MFGWTPDLRPPIRLPCGPPRRRMRIIRDSIATGRAALLATQGTQGQGGHGAAPPGPARGAGGGARGRAGGAGRGCSELGPDGGVRPDLSGSSPDLAAARVLESLLPHARGPSPQAAVRLKACPLAPPLAASGRLPPPAPRQAPCTSTASPAPRQAVRAVASDPRNPGPDIRSGALLETLEPEPPHPHTI